MAKIENRLDLWVKNGLLAAEQADQIRAFENLQGSSQRNWALWGIVIIGVAAIAIGLISIVAANWFSIPGTTKLVVYGILQTGIGLAVWFHFDRPGILREALITIFALTFFAGIGLTGQVFNLQSKGYSALYFWCGLTLPIILLSASRFINYLWVIALLGATTIYATVHLDRANDFDIIMFYFWHAGMILYLCMAAGFARIGTIQVPVYLGEALRVLTLLIVFIGGSVIGTFFWYINTGREFASGLDGDILRSLQMIPWVGSVPVCAAIALNSPDFGRRLKISLCVLMIALTAFVTMPVSLGLGELRATGAILSIFVWMIAGFAAVYANRKRLFDTITMIIVIRMVVIYFEVFGSLSATGIGLIISGFLILGAAFLWYKFRTQLMTWIGQSR